MSVHVLPLAELDLAAASDWYETQEQGLGDKFTLAVEAVLKRVGTKPLQFPKSSYGTRRALVRKFPYAVHFQIQGDSCIVVAVLHQRQDVRRLEDRV
jgi:plasmid stabilization system protein ParE